MSRNHTEYHVLKRDDENFLDSVRTCKTFDRARRVLAVTGADEITKWKVTPSGVALTTAYPVKQRRDSLKKLYRKHNRREADKKKQVARKQRKEKEREALFAATLELIDRTFVNIVRLLMRLQSKPWEFCNSYAEVTE